MFAPVKPSEMFSGVGGIFHITKHQAELSFIAEKRSKLIQLKTSEELLPWMLRGC